MAEQQTNKRVSARATGIVGIAVLCSRVLGLIREINLNEDPAVVDMMMTTPFCPYAGWLVQQVKQESEPVAGKSVRVNVLPDVWDPSFMEDPGILSGWS